MPSASPAPASPPDRARSVPGRWLVQRAAAGHVAALRDGPAALEAALRRRLGPPGAGRRHGAGFGRLLPGDREPRACRSPRRPRWRISSAIATDRSRRRPGEATANADRAARRCAVTCNPRHAAVISGASGAAARRPRRRIPARPRHAGARHRDRARPFAGAVVPRQPGAGGDVGVAAPAVRPAGAGRGADGRRRCARCWSRPGATGAAKSLAVVEAA